MKYVLILRIDTAQAFLEQYFQSEVSKLTSVEIAPDFEMSTTIEYKQVTVKALRKVGDELFAKSMKDGLLSRWRGYLKKAEKEFSAM